MSDGLPDAQPVLRTPRLVLRPYAPADAADVQRLAGAAEIADTTMNVPHPYLDGMAEEWIASHEPAWRGREFAPYAITSSSGELLGSISLRLELKHRRGELGYWVGVPYWNRGYATEAAVAMLAWAFGPLELNRVHATHLTRNPASGRVMQKAGMSFEGIRKEYFLKDGRFEDVAVYAALRGTWRQA